VRKWQRHTFPSPRPNCADSRDEGGTSDDGGAPDRLGGINRRRNSGCWRRLDCRSDLRVDVWARFYFRSDNTGTNYAEHGPTWYRAAWHNTAAWDSAAGNSHPDAGYCSSHARNRDSWNHPEHNHYADAADDAQ
jgi:hypothetical protein